LKVSEWLDERDLSLILRIIDVLIQTGKEPVFQISEEKKNYKADEKKELISKIRNALSSPDLTLSLKESWVREALKVALSTLEEK